MPVWVWPIWERFSSVTLSLLPLWALNPKEEEADEPCCHITVFWMKGGGRKDLEQCPNISAKTAELHSGWETPGIWLWPFRDSKEISR